MDDETELDAPVCVVLRELDGAPADALSVSDVLVVAALVGNDADDDIAVDSADAVSDAELLNRVLVEDFAVV